MGLLPKAQNTLPNIAGSSETGRVLAEVFLALHPSKQEGLPQREGYSCFPFTLSGEKQRVR